MEEEEHNRRKYVGDDPPQYMAVKFHAKGIHGRKKEQTKKNKNQCETMGGGQLIDHY